MVATKTAAAVFRARPARARVEEFAKAAPETAPAVNLASMRVLRLDSQACYLVVDLVPA
jgi:hypothetical protein